MTPPRTQSRPPRITRQEEGEFYLWDLADELVIQIHEMRKLHAKLKFAIGRLDAQKKGKP